MATGSQARDLAGGAKFDRSARAPLLFRLSRWMVRRGVRGGWRLWRHLHQSGALARVVEYPLAGRARAAPLRVPLDRVESSWSAEDVRDYESEIHKSAGRLIERSATPAFLIDCGADIGVVASAFARDYARIEGVLAFEPNAEAYAYLKASLDLWPIPARAVNAAVGEFAGRGRLVAGPLADAHACYIVEDPNGPIEVRRIDNDPPPRDKLLVLKIDVEGAEHAVVRGALKSLAAAPAFIVIFEAHPKVFARTGVDPCETIRLLATIAPIDVSVCGNPAAKIDPHLPFFDQLGDRRGMNCNVMCASRPAAQ